MKKNYLFQIFILICVIVIILSVLLFSDFSAKIHSAFSVPEEALIVSFENSGAKHIGSDIRFNAVLDDRFEDRTNLDMLLLDISDELGLEKISSTTFGNDLLKKEEIKGISNGNESVAIIIEDIQEDFLKNSNMSDNNNTSKKLTVEMTADFSYDRLVPLRKTIDAVFKKYKIEAEVNSCITGYFEGKVGHMEMNEICENIFTAAGAKKVGNSAKQNLVTVSAYTPAISEFIVIDKHRMNLNLDIRYNSYEEKTYIWLTTPGLH